MAFFGKNFFGSGFFGPASDTTISSTLGGAGDYFRGKTPWQIEQEAKNKKIKEEDDLCLLSVIKCFILIQTRY